MHLVGNEAVWETASKLEVQSQQKAAEPSLTSRLVSLPAKTVNINHVSVCSVVFRVLLCAPQISWFSLLEVLVYQSEEYFTVTNHVHDFQMN